MCIACDPKDTSSHGGLVEHVFAALPWPCMVWEQQGQPVLTNLAFRQTFGSMQGDPDAWVAGRLDHAGADVVHDVPGGTRRFRLNRQVLQAGGTTYQAIFLMPLPDDEPTADEAAPHPLASLRPGVKLTRRESQVLDGIMLGKMNKVIASELNISPKTVELHRANLMAKLRVHNVVELARTVLHQPPASLTDEPDDVAAEKTEAAH
jgi:DNA-binding CsgD family transcriptional regulator